MDNINAEHHGKIALHQHHGLAGDFSIKRLHFTSKNREELAKLNTSFPGFTLSTSVHSVKEMNELDPCFSYCFFGPLFESISKVGYGPASKTGNWPLPASLHTKVVALGGIDESKLVEVRKKGFSHIALLGAIWKSSDPVNTFERIKELWKTKERTY